MKVFGLIGDPVRHSLSPVMHAAAFREFGLEAEYTLVQVAADRTGDLRAAMESLATSGGGNVTVPHKRTAAALLDSGSDDVRLTGACNCFWSDGDGGVKGDNTDVGGILAVLRSLPGLDLMGGSVLIVGSGERRQRRRSRRAVPEPRPFSVLNRSADRAARLVDRLNPVSPAFLSVAPPQTQAGDHDLVIQATSLGLQPTDPLPCEFGTRAPAHAIDLVYGRGETAWVKHARDRGVSAIDGLAVLFEQGVLSLERWLGRPMPIAVRNAMWDALESAAR